MAKNIIDVCWTMYRSNTTFDFIAFVMKEQKKMIFLYHILNLYVVKLFLVVLGKIFKHDYYRYFYIGLLKGYHRNELISYVEQFYQNFLQTKKIDFTFDLLSKLKNKDDIILCSASLDIIVEKIASDLNVKYFASTLLFENEVCLGKIGSDLLYSKHDIFSKEHINYVITDNLSDYKLIEKAKKPIVLSTQKNLKFWEERNIHVSYIFDGV
ncbi:hypothetical protein QSV37_16765 [Acinetobacter sp. VNK23]|uniref:hypothetical protein n=1 Tax=Acinetobacter thutiue TaxID=2998078 RepID=UPI002577976B|nr:hypothetical protein [Acinetobacter thutiue]MDM1021928.1 hypothetical protein [Acinetobacter thutiue]